MPRKIITTDIFPPIPVRTFDFCAHFEGDEESGHYGYGSTEAEAVADFVENCIDDQAEYDAQIESVRKAMA